jgi:uncharacterized Zn finger protein (UPF0148 family)
MAQEFNCPHCGCPLLAIQGTVRVPGADTVEILHQEIGHLRATIARRCGAGFNALFRRVSAGANPTSS